MKHSPISAAVLAASGLMPYAAHAGGTYTRALVDAPIATVALAHESRAQIDIAIAIASKQQHAAVVTAPVIAAALGPGRTATVHIASSARKHSIVVATRPVIAIAAWRNSKVVMD